MGTTLALDTNGWSTNELFGFRVRVADVYDADIQWPISFDWEILLGRDQLSSLTAFDTTFVKEAGANQFANEKDFSSGYSKGISGTITLDRASYYNFSFDKHVNQEIELSELYGVRITNAVGIDLGETTESLFRISASPSSQWAYISLSDENNNESYVPEGEIPFNTIIRSPFREEYYSEIKADLNFNLSFNSAHAFASSYAAPSDVGGSTKGKLSIPIKDGSKTQISEFYANNDDNIEESEYFYISGSGSYGSYYLHLSNWWLPIKDKTTKNPEDTPVINTPIIEDSSNANNVVNKDSENIEGVIYSENSSDDNDSASLPNEIDHEPLSETANTTVSDKEFSEISYKDTITGQIINVDYVTVPVKRRVQTSGGSDLILIGESYSNINSRSVLKIVDFNSDNDLIGLSDKYFSVLQGGLSFRVAKNKKKLKYFQGSEQGNLIYFRGRLFYDENGQDKGYGEDGGLIAKFKGNPALEESHIIIYTPNTNPI